MDVLDRIHSGYGEQSGSGVRQGRQGPIVEGGNAYLDQNFPLLDRLMRATLVEDQLPEQASEPERASEPEQAAAPQQASEPE